MGGILSLLVRSGHAVGDVVRGAGQVRCRGGVVGGGARVIDRGATCGGVDQVPCLHSASPCSFPQTGEV